MRLRTGFVLTVVAALGATCLPLGHADDDAPWALEARVPATSLGIVSIEDVASMGARWEKTALAGLLREPDMQAFLGPLAEGLEKMAASDDGPMGQIPPPLRRLLMQLQNLRGQLAVAVVGLDPDSGAPRAVASLDFRENVAAFASFLEEFRSEVDPEGEHIKQRVVDGRTVWSVEEGDLPISATIHGSAFLIATHPDLLTMVTGAPPAESLAGTAGYQYARTHARADGLALFAYANVPAIVATLGDAMGPETLAMANALGLDTVKGAAYGMAFDGDGFRDTIVVYGPDADHGVLTLARTKPVQGELVPWAPATTFLFNESRSTLDGLMTNVRKMVATLDPDAVQEFDEGLAYMGDALGVDIEKELIGGLSGEAGMYLAMPETGGLYPELAIFLKAKDAGAFENAMDRLVRGLAGMLSEDGGVVASTRSIRFREHELHMMELQGARRQQMIPFTPTWTRVAGTNWFAITLVPHAMKELVLRATTRTGGGGLAAQEDFQALWEGRPSDTGEFTYVDLQSVLTLLYDTGVPLLQTLAKPNMLPDEIPTLDWAQLPPTRIVRPYLRSLAAYSTWDDNGLTISMHGPIPLTAVLVVAAAAAVPAFMLMGGGRMEMGEVMADDPDLMEIHQEIVEMQARDLAKSVQVYVVQRGALPTSLQDLVREQLVDSLPADPWGNPFRLIVVDAAANRFQLLSPGPDGRVGTEDDVLVDG